MPKILRIINRLNVGGPTYNVGLLTKHLPATYNQYETLLVAGMKDDTEESSEFILNKLAIKPHYIPNMYRAINPLKDLPAYQEIKQIIRNYKPDIVHTHAAKAGALGRLAAYEMGVPVIVHTFHGHVFHSYFGNLKTQFYIYLERFLASISNGIIALSPQQKHELSNLYKIANPQKINIVPLGFDLNRFQENQTPKRQQWRQQYHLQPNEIAIGIVGRLVSIKNHELFLNAAQQIAQQTRQQVRFFIIGDGDQRRFLENKCRELQLTHNTQNADKKPLVTFTSWIKNIDEAYAGLDIVALTSLNEGTPVSLIEAQASNKPIVSTQVGGVQDVVVPNVTALLSPSNCTPNFANNLLKLIENDNLRTAMGKNSYEFVKQKYCYTRLVNDMHYFYQHLLAKKMPQNYPLPNYMPQPEPAHAYNYTTQNGIVTNY